MTFALRQLARSRRLRTMGVLAWLALVLNALMAAPLGMPVGGHAMHARMATMPMAVDHHHGVTAKASHVPRVTSTACCGAPAAYGCHCPAMGGSVLPAVAPAMLLPLAQASVYGRLAGIAAPSPETSAPLRPPAA